MRRDHVIPQALKVVSSRRSSCPDQIDHFAKRPHAAALSATCLGFQYQVSDGRDEPMLVYDAVDQEAFQEGFRIFADQLPGCLQLLEVESFASQALSDRCTMVRRHDQKNGLALPQTGPGKEANRFCHLAFIGVRIDDMPAWLRVLEGLDTARIHRLPFYMALILNVSLRFAGWSRIGKPLPGQGTKQEGFRQTL